MTPSPTFTFTTTIQPPPGLSTPLYLPTHPYAPQNPPIFNDAMHVRARVFIDEQHCSPEGEIDTDDARSWQWVIYASPPASSNNTPHQGGKRSDSSSGQRIPVAVIRLVPPPQPPHALLTNPSDEGNKHLPAYDWTHEACIKLTRVAVLPEYRGHGLGRRLVQTALEWASSHASEINDAAVRLAQTEDLKVGCGTPKAWTGLVLVHAQVDVERMYTGLGFVTDEELGRWDEEGIEHVGMFRRVEVQ